MAERLPLVPFELAPDALAQFAADCLSWNAAARLRAFFLWWRRSGIMICNNPEEWFRATTRALRGAKFSSAAIQLLTAGLVSGRMEYSVVARNPSIAALPISLARWEDEVRSESILRCSASEAQSLVRLMAPLLGRVRILDRFALSSDSRGGWPKLLDCLDPSIRIEVDCARGQRDGDQLPSDETQARDTLSGLLGPGRDFELRLHDYGSFFHYGHERFMACFTKGAAGARQPKWLMILGKGVSSFRERATVIGLLSPDFYQAIWQHYQQPVGG